MSAVAPDAGSGAAQAPARESVRAEVGYIAPIEGMRGLSVLWVMLFHYVALRAGLGDPWVAALLDARPLEAFARNGALAVDLFFLISGFLLALPWFLHAAAARPAPSAREFYRRRFLRIAPAYYVHLAILFAVAMPLLQGLMWWRPDAFVVAFNAIAHALFVHNLTPLTSGSFGVNGALWTLAVEAQFYLLVPLMAPLFARWPAASLAACAAIAIVWHHGVGSGFDALVAGLVAIGTHWDWPEKVVRDLLRIQLPAYLGHFALGMALGRAWIAWRRRAEEPAVRLAVAASVTGSVALLYWILTREGVDRLGPVASPLMVFCIGALLFGAAMGRGAVARALLARGPLAFAGRVSYSMYLYHLPVLYLWNRFGSAIPGWASLPLYFATVSIIAWVSWKFVEETFRK